jgi:hypothetical protein
MSPVESLGSTLDREMDRLAPHPMSMIWFSVSHAKANDSSGTFFNGCGFALRARQSKDFGWCPRI